jgi:hypothetical protein
VLKIIKEAGQRGISLSEMLEAIKGSRNTGFRGEGCDQRRDEIDGGF